MLEIKDLVVKYGAISALKSISFHINKKEIVCLIGANGAGKSTTLNAISNIVPKISGQIIFNGKDITRTKANIIARSGLSQVPEGRHVFPKASVEENLLLGAIADRNAHKSEINERMQEMFALFPRLKERRRQQAATLSGGEQQMLAIARGLMCNPALLMLDEPSLGLAPIIVDEIFELLIKIRDAGKTVLLVEQNASRALQISDRAYLLEIGKIVKTGTGVELLNDDSIQKAYLGG